MKCCSPRLGLARRLLALPVSFAVVLSSFAFAIASPAKSAGNLGALNRGQVDSQSTELQLTSASATATKAGVMLRWSTNSVADNLGFNVYRVNGGERTRANKEIIPGAAFAVGTPALMRAGYSFAWFDRGGSADSIYFIESVSVAGAAKMHGAIRPVTSKTVPDFEAPEALNGGSATESNDTFEKHYPAAEAEQPAFGGGTLQDQWVIAGQTALKIAINKVGWYRVTQAQMVAAGFNPTVDIRNLRLFVDATEVAINTNQLQGQFGSGDYIEFYGTGLDTPTTDKRIYYLIAGTVPGKRVSGEIQLDGDPVLPPPPAPTPTPTPPPAPVSAPPPSITPASPRPVLRDPIFSTRINLSWLMNTKEAEAAFSNSSPVVLLDRPDEDLSDRSPVVSRLAGTLESPATMASANSPGAAPAAGPAPALAAPAMKPATPAPQPAVKTGRQLRKRLPRRRKARRHVARQPKQEHSHALSPAGFAPANFAYTTERKDRGVYFVSLLNGDAENFFGQVITYNALNPTSQTINSPNPDLTSAEPAHLEIAIQGANQVNHQISVEFNGVVVGAFSFFGSDAFEGHSVRIFDIPGSQLQNGPNTIRFILPAGGDVSIVDYVKLTYSHAYKADTNSLKFNLRGSQTLKVDGFSTPTVRMIDYTDPSNVRLTKPASEPSATGYAITVPQSVPFSKDQRLLYAIPYGQFDQAAALSLSQPSSLNQGVLSATITSGADFLIIAHKNFIASMTPLVNKRQSEGKIAAVVDIDDVYDEFSYGGHGPQAIQDFISYTLTSPLWVSKPRDIIFAGDASLDPRNYQGAGDFDLVPTKLVDATYNETASDDWLADFHGDPTDDGPDGIADIPIGRLPFRTAADADLLVSRIVNFAPVLPQAAMLVADDPGTPAAWDFETASNEVEALLLPAGMTVQKSYRRLEIKALTGTISTDTGSATVTGTGTLFTTETQFGTAITNNTGEWLGIVASISSATSLILTTNAYATYTGSYAKQDNATATAHIIAGFNQGRAIVNYSGHGNVDVWTGASIFTTANALALTNGNNKLPFVVVMDCLNGYFQDPNLLSLSEAFLKAPGGGAVAAFASSGLTTTPGQRQMELQLYSTLYGSSPIALGDAIKIAKGATFDIDVKRTWIFFGDPSMKIR